MITRKLECRRFVPNIFDKRKCSNCFRQREEHNADALSDFNQMSRKILKCGYLFVAPDWDFNNAVFRSKRWQRRWFVLFDDGELTYAVDDHIDTVPQGVVDVTKAIDICSAEKTTGHPFSLCIAGKDTKTYVKGSFPEEIKWWLNQLRPFIKSKNRFKQESIYRDNRNPLYFQPVSSHPNLSDSYTDVVDFGYQPNASESLSTRPKSLECANIIINNRDLQVENSQFTRKIKTANRSLTLPLFTNMTPLPLHQSIKDNTNLNTNLLEPQKPQERGDPDGDCGFEKMPINCMRRISEYNSQIEEMGKGWLYKKDSCGIWYKHWFAQKSAALFYYRDTIAEERGILDGVLDLNNVTDIKVDNSINNKFGFVLTTWDKQKITLAALSENARTHWLTIIKIVTGKGESKELMSNEEKIPLNLKVKNQDNEAVTNESTVDHLYELQKQLSLKNNARKSSKHYEPHDAKPSFISQSDKKLRRIGSVSNLTELPEINPYKTEKHTLAKEYNELKYRFQKIVEELRILKKELKEAYYNYDTLEIDYKALKTDMEQFRCEEQARVSMMAERIEDLTNKYTLAEKNARNWKLKLSRAERKRSISLKGREYLNKDQELDASEILLKDDIYLIESKLNYELHKLLNERLILLEENQLSTKKKKELLLQRLAYESVYFEHLKSFVQPKKFPLLKEQSTTSEIESKVAELQRKINDESSSIQFKKNDIFNTAPIKLLLFDILSLVTQKRNQTNVLEKLVTLQKGLILLVEKYKKHKIECLLYSITSDNTNLREDVLQNIINEVSNCAMKKVNEDLIKYEIDHIMAFLNRSCDNLIMSPLPLTMISTDMYYFEIFFDKIYESLKHELAIWISEMKTYFDKILLKIKEGQWCFQLEQERKCNENKSCISDLSNIIVLKSIIDGQILFMTSDHSSEVPSMNDKNAFFAFLEELKNQYLLLEESFNEVCHYNASKTIRSHEELSVASEENYVSKQNMERYAQTSSVNKNEDKSFCTSTEKTLQKRYREEIEQLRTLCQRGMDAMRSSHKALICEMEESHKKQIQQLMIEKEQALAEETKATLAALDAMQKAHKNEVQREILRFKNEFIKQSQQYQDSELVLNDHQKKSELEEIRQEIWSLSEKYTNKCLQVASLEEKLYKASEKIQELEDTIKKLEIKNQRLRTSVSIDESCHPLKDSPVKSKSMRIFQKCKASEFETQLHEPVQNVQEAFNVNLPDNNYLELYETVELNI